MTDSKEGPSFAQRVPGSGGAPILGRPTPAFAVPNPPTGFQAHRNSLRRRPTPDLTTPWGAKLLQPKREYEDEDDYRQSEQISPPPRPRPVFKAPPPPTSPPPEMISPPSRRWATVESLPEITPLEAAPPKPQTQQPAQTSITTIRITAPPYENPNLDAETDSPAPSPPETQKTESRFSEHDTKGIMEKIKEVFSDEKFQAKLLDLMEEYLLKISLKELVNEANRELDNDKKSSVGDVDYARSPSPESTEIDSDHGKQEVPSPHALNPDGRRFGDIYTGR